MGVRDVGAPDTGAPDTGAPGTGAPDTGALCRKISDSRFVRFAGVGAANTGVHYAAYLSLWTVLPYLAAHCVATALATICSYLLNCRFTFRVRPTAGGLALYPLSNVTSIAVSAATVLVAVEAFGTDSRLAGVAGGLVALPATFLASQAVVTRSRPAPEAARWWWAELRCAGLIAVLVAALCQIPVLANPSFYFWDDSAAQFLPMWHKLGQRLVAGDWPLMLDTDSWMGGNLAAESLFGIWNPVNLLDFLLVVWSGDLAVAATVVKTQFLVLLAVGVFVLCREYGATRPAASVLATAFPVSGFVLYFEAASWAGGLMGLAWLPWAWWSLRRLTRKPGAVLVAFVFCFLCLSSGDPYGVLGLCLVFAGLLLECWAVSEARSVRRLLLAGCATALVLPLIFLPVVAAGPVSWRNGFELFNNGLLAADIGDLLNLSVPSYVPRITSFGSFRMTVPAVYFAWFAIPLLAWLDWCALAASWRSYTAALVLASGYLGLCLGPSNVWLFRWPLRHIVMLLLALSVLFALALSCGLRTDRFRVRLMWTVGALSCCAYLSFAAWPSASVKHVISVATLGGLLALVLRTAKRGAPAPSMAMILHVGTVCVLCLQMLWFPANRDVAIYNFPSDVREIHSSFAEFRGRTVAQVADRVPIAPQDIASREMWKHTLFGNMYATAGVPSLVSYTGIGYRALHSRLCLNYYGSTCPDAYDRLWSRDEAGAPLADQLKIDDIVVQRKLVDAPQPPPGWRVTVRNGLVTVISRIGHITGNGRVSVARGVTVSSDVLHDQRHETVAFSRAVPRAELVFARLAWPGYQATVDGVPVPVRSTSAGLVAVTIPEGLRAGSLALTWSPPGFSWCVALALLGLVLAVAMSLPGVRRGWWSR